MKLNKIIPFVIITLILRLLYGLIFGFVHAEDHQFVYALGLKFFTTGEWPYFGPDVVYTQSQIPGALQALWIAVPLWLIPIPESPYIFLTIGVVGSLSFLSWYLTQLNFSLPPMIIWLWVGTMPWAIFFGSTLVNPTYVMIYAIGFMVGFYEIVREKISPQILSDRVCYFLMGLAIISIAQLHLSWVLLLPLVGGAWIFDYQYKQGWRHGLKKISSLLFGFLIGGISLFPTLVHYGPDYSGGVEKNIIFNLVNYKDFFKTYFNFMYFPSYQVVTLMNNYSVVGGRQGELILKEWWSIPFFFIPFVFGFLQIGFYSWGLLGLSPLRDLSRTRWFRIRWIVIIAGGYTWLSFFFNDSGNSAHKYFLFFPLMVIYSLFILEWAWKKSWFRKCYFLALTLMLSSYLINSIDSRYFFSNPYQFYRVREKISSAIRERDYSLYSKTRYDHFTNQLGVGKKTYSGY